MDKQTLKQFLVDSNKAGYAGGEEKKWIKEKWRDFPEKNRLDEENSLSIKQIISAV